MKKLIRLFVIALILTASVVSFSACGKIQAPSIYGNLKSNSDKFTVFFLVEANPGIVPAVSVEPDSVITLPDAEVKDNKLIGWSEIGPFDAYPMAAGSEYTVRSTVALFAVLETNNLKTVVFNVKGDVGLVRNRFAAKGTITVLPDCEVTSHTFKGWSTTGPDDEKPLPQMTPYLVNDDVTFYAVLVKDSGPYDSATVQFSVDGVLREELECTVEAGSAIDLPNPSELMPDSTFLGWLSDENDITSLRHPGSKFVANKSTVLYAKFVSKVTVIFDVAGYRDIIPPVTVDPETIIALPGTDLTGYAFIGWSETGPFDPNPLPPESWYRVTQNTLLFAVFSQPTVVYDVHHNGIDYNEGGYNVPPVQVDAGSSIQLPVLNWNVPGYKLLGWSGTGPEDSNPMKPGSAYVVNADALLYAVLGENTTVYFEVYGRTDIIGPLATAIGEDITLPNASNMMSGDYYISGWSLTPPAAGAQVRLTSPYKVTGEVTLYPVWALTQVTIRFVVGGDDSLIAPVVCDINSDIILPDVIIQDCDFQGWSLNSNLTGTLYGAGSMFKAVGNTTFYARLMTAQIRTQFSVNGAIVPSLTQTVSKDSQITLPDPDIQGYVLRGWSLQNGSAVRAPSSSHTASQDAIFYAVLDAATEDYTYGMYSGGECYVVAYSGNANKLTIPSSYNGYTVVGIGPYAFYGNSTVVSVTLPQNVRTISDGAFYYAQSLENINLDNIVYIGSFAFCYAGKLKLSSLNSINALQYIGASAFAYASVQAADRETPLVLTPMIQTIQSNAFDGWTSSMSIVITAVNKRFENHGYWSGGGATITDANGQGFAFDYNTWTGECTLIGYHGSGAVIVIPEQVYFSGRFYKVTAIADNAFANYQIPFTKVIMGAEIISIGDSAFKDNLYLGTVVFNGLFIFIGDDAFSGTLWYFKQL